MEKPLAKLEITEIATVDIINETETPLHQEFQEPNH